jgi:hypothetical protein
MVGVVLPVEYGIDLTGVGKITGLKKMGEIKMSLVEEARQQDEKKVATENEKKLAVEQEPVATPAVLSAQTTNTDSDQQPDTAAPEKDSTTAIITPNGSAEIKVAMSEGATVKYLWKTENGPINYNVHGEPTDDGAAYEYAKGLNETQQDSSITAAFDGTHGWFFRNRSDGDVTVTIEVEGEFSDLKQL